MRRGGEDQVRDRPLRLGGRRRQHDAPNARDLRREAAHQDRRGVGRGPARRVDPRGRDRHLAQLDRLALLELDRRVSAPSCASRDGADVARRRSPAPSRISGSSRVRAPRRTSPVRHRQHPGVDRTGAEALLELARPRRRPARERRRRSRRRPRSPRPAAAAARGSRAASAGGVPPVPVEALDSHQRPSGAVARPARRPPRRAACARRGWRPGGRCSRRSPRAPRGRSPPACGRWRRGRRCRRRGPTSGASSTEPLTSITSAWRPVCSKWRSAIRGYLVAIRIIPRRRSASSRRSSPAAPGEDHAAGAEAEVEQLVDDPVALLEQHVLAGDPEVGGAGLDVGGDVGGPHRHQGQLAGLEDQRARVARAARRCRCRSRRARRASPPESAPRGSASFSGPASPGARGLDHPRHQRVLLFALALLLRLGDVQRARGRGRSPAAGSSRPKRPSSAS